MYGHANSEVDTTKLYFTEEDASGFRHKLGNVVTVIKSYSSLMLTASDQGLPLDNTTDHLKTIVENANRVQDAMAKFTLLQQVNSGGLKPIANLTPTHFVDIIEHTCAWYAASIERKDLTITHDIADDVSTVNGESYLKYIIQELMHNAIQAAEKSGRIHVTVAREQNTLLLSIHDNGMGIPAEEHHQVGERWHGGIGLYLVYRVVEDVFGGRVSFSSVEYDCTSFYIQIPL